MRPFEAPESGETQGGSELCDESDDVVGQALAVVVMNPDLGRIVGWLGCEREAGGPAFVVAQAVVEGFVEFCRGGCESRVGQVEGAGKVGEVVSHGFGSFGMGLKKTKARRGGRAFVRRRMSLI